MRVVVIGLVFAAVILAGGTAYLLRSYLTSQEAEFAAMIPKAPTTSVMVAGADMPTGTVINAKNIEWQPWPEDAIQEEFLVRRKGDNPLQKLVDEKHVTRFGILKGEPITKAKLYKSGDPGFLPGSLAPGMRAIAVKSNAEVSAGGFVLPGDRVDMVLTHKMVRRAMEQHVGEEPESIIALEYTSETILEDLRVLAVDQKVDEFETGAMVSKTVLLEVTPKQAEIINTAKNMGKLSLSLRAAEEGEPRTGRPFTTDVEVSPLLSSFDKLVAGEDGGYRGFGGDVRPRGDYQTSDEYDDAMGSDAMNDEPAPIFRPKPAAKAPTLAQPSAPKSASTPTRRKITVYRGAGATAAAEAEDDLGDLGDAADEVDDVLDDGTEDYGE